MNSKSPKTIREIHDNFMGIEHEMTQRILKTGYRDPVGIETVCYPYNYPDFPKDHPFLSKPARPGVIEPMLQLCTRDGKRTGNATVMKITVNARIPEPESQQDIETMFHIVTDADNVLILNIEELNELFTLGEWILKEYPNSLSRIR